MDGMGMEIGGDSSSLTPLTSAGVDFSNATQAADFLAAMLDDTVYQVQGNQYARYFYYCVVVVIALFAISNAYIKMLEKIRLVVNTLLLVK